MALLWALLNRRIFPHGDTAGALVYADPLMWRQVVLTFAGPINQATGEAPWPKGQRDKATLGSQVLGKARSSAWPSAPFGGIP